MALFLFTCYHPHLPFPAFRKDIKFNICQKFPILQHSHVAGTGYSFGFCFLILLPILNIDRLPIVKHHLPNDTLVHQVKSTGFFTISEVANLFFYTRMRSITFSIKLINKKSGSSLISSTKWIFHFSLYVILSRPLPFTSRATSYIL